MCKSIKIKYGNTGILQLSCCIWRDWKRQLGKLLFAMYVIDWYWQDWTEWREIKKSTQDKGKHSFGLITRAYTRVEIYPHRRRLTLEPNPHQIFHIIAFFEITRNIKLFNWVPNITLRFSKSIAQCWRNQSERILSRFTFRKDLRSYWRFTIRRWFSRFLADVVPDIVG